MVIISLIYRFPVDGLAFHYLGLMKGVPDPTWWMSSRCLSLATSSVFHWHRERLQIARSQQMRVCPQPGVVSPEVPSSGLHCES